MRSFCDIIFIEEQREDKKTQRGDVIVKKLWLQIVIDTSIAFKEVTPCSYFSGRKGKNFKFEGYDIIWFNGDEKCYPFIVIPYNDPADYSKEIEIGCRFLSLVAYELNRPIKRLSIYAGKGLGRQPRKLGDHRVSADTLMDVSLPGNQKKKIALGLYREGLDDSTNPFWACLSLYKIFELHFGKNTKAIQKWINANVGKVRNSGARERLKELRQRGKRSIGKHIYKSVRCAIAHAYKNPMIDPDNTKDYDELRRDCWLLQDLARILIDSGVFC